MASRKPQRLRNIPEEMPVTPLLEAPPSPDFYTLNSNASSSGSELLSQADSSCGTKSTPRRQETKQLQNKKKACAGMLIFGGVVAVALIIVGVVPRSSLHEVGEWGKESPVAEARMATVERAEEEEEDPEILGHLVVDEQNRVLLYCPQHNSNSSADEANQLHTNCSVFSDVPDQRKTSLDDLLQMNTGLDRLISQLKTNTSNQAELLDNLSSFLAALTGDSTEGEGDFKQIMAYLAEVMDKRFAAKPMPEKVVGQVISQLEMELKVGIASPGARSLEEDLARASAQLIRAPVQCTGKQVRCKDGLRCYEPTKYCDYHVDCLDFSDENNCSCVNLLGKERLCDGYSDCPNGEDEMNCKCPADQFFCSPNTGFGPPLCIPQDLVCDGRVDCKNARDEVDCLLLAPDTQDLATFRPALASTSGLLVKKTGNTWKYLAVKDGFTEKSENYVFTLQVCSGILRSNEPSVNIVEGNLDKSKVVLLDQLDKNGRMKTVPMVSNQFHLLEIDCNLESCFAELRTKREEPIATNSTTSQVIASSTEDMEETARIVGGRDVEIGDWPFTAAIYRNGSFICGATVIGPEWIVTAGHCLFGFDTLNYFYRVRTGLLRRQSQSPWEQVRTISEIYIHPRYDKIFLSNDIALAKLDRPLAFNLFTQQACLPNSPDMNPATGDLCTAAGWGDLVENGPTSETLKELSVPILPSCLRSYDNITTAICAGAEGGKDACQGDSGGPFYCRNEKEKIYLAGVISHGKGCARPGEPGVYVRLSYYLDFINNIVDDGSSFVKNKRSPMATCPGLTCDNGMCVNPGWICDPTVDCLDGSDVKNCRTVNGKGVLVGSPNTTMSPTLTSRPVSSSATTRGEKSITIRSTTVPTESKAVPQVQGKIHSVLQRVLSLRDVSLECGKGWKCATLKQCLPAQHRCDGVPQCPDWSDESGCTCLEYLKRTNPKVVCDGFPDCVDSSDETNCATCAPGQFRCQYSQQCIPKERRCDQKADCIYSEDEAACTVLVNQNFVPVNSFGGVVHNQTGILVVQTNNVWTPLCALKFTSPLSNDICSYMGFSAALNYTLVRPNQTAIADYQAPLQEVIIPDGRGVLSSPPCSFVQLSCGSSFCGQRMIYQGSSLAGPTLFPWTAALLADGVYVCGATIIHERFVLTSVFCAVTLMRSGEYLTVVAGQHRSTAVGLSPYTQIRRLLTFKIIPETEVAIGYLSSELWMTDYVAKLCIPSLTWVPQGITCYVSGRDKASWSSGVAVTVAGVCNYATAQDYDLCSCSAQGIKLPAHCKNTPKAGNLTGEGWSGALACPDKDGIFFAVGVYAARGAVVPTVFQTLVSPAIRTGIPALIKTTLAEAPRSALDLCPFRCSIGTCLKKGQVCDGSWDCPDGRDEASCNYPMPYPTCAMAPNSTDCQCPENFGRCDNQMCIPMERYCDGKDDCGDGSDEKKGCRGCYQKFRFEGSTRICDGRLDCPDGGDEAASVCGCPDDTYRCDILSGNRNDPSSCQPLSSLCDGRKDCNSSGVDEQAQMCLTLSSLLHVEQSVLLRPQTLYTGYLKLRIKGRWFSYCYPEWQDSLSEGVCRRLGFSGVDMWLQHVPIKVKDIGQTRPNQKTSKEAENCKLVYISCISNSTRTIGM